jgi:phage/plasmid primase-like uncharacterized protein
MLSAILTEYRHTIADMAASCGIDWNKAQHLASFDGRKVNRGIELSPKYRGKVFLVSRTFIAEDGREYPNLFFYTNKHNEAKEFFNGFSEYWSDKGRSSDWISKQTSQHVEVKPTKAIAEPQNTAEYKRRKEKFDNAVKAWAEADGIVQTYPYIIKKGVCLDGIEIRRGGFKLNESGFSYQDCLITRLFDIDGNLKAFQFINHEGVKRYVIAHEGAKKGAFALIGDASLIETHGAMVVEGLATGLSVYHATGNGKTTIRNTDHRPVVVALDEGNLEPVFEALTDRYKGVAFDLYADNDHTSEKEKGNAGRLRATKICKSFDLPHYWLPVGNDGSLDIKIDFNDTQRFKRIDKLNAVDFALAMVDFCHISSLPNMARSAAYALAATVPAKQTIDEAKTILQARMVARGADYRAIRKALNYIEWALKIRADNILKRNRVTDSFEVFDVTGLPNNQIDFALDMRGYAICDTRGMGCGKTQLMAARINRLDECAVISFRTSIIDSLCNLASLDHYRDGDRYADKIALCVNSLLKYMFAVMGKPLFLDEARQILETIIHAQTIDKKVRQKLFDAFIEVLKACPSLHLADAQLDDDTINFFKKYCPHLKFIVVKAETARHDAKHTALNSIEAGKSAVVEDLRAGNSGVVGCTSIDESKIFYDFVLESGVDESEILLINSENKGGAKQAAFLADVNGEAKKYRLIIYTSALGTGISIENDAFEFTYLLCWNVLPSNENLQMLARNRKAKRVYVAFGRQFNSSRIADADAIKRRKLEEVRNFAADRYIEIGDDFLNELGLMQAELEARVNDDLNNMVGNFLMLADLEGRDFERADIHIDSATASAMKQSKAATKERVRTEVLNSKAADLLELKKLKNKSALTQIESNILTRGEVTAMVGSNQITLEDVANYERGYKAKLNNYLLLTADTEELKTIDRENFENKSGLRSLSSRQKILKAFLKPLVGAGDRISTKDFVKACDALRKYNNELGGDFGRFDKPVFACAGRTVGAVLKKIGIDLVQTSQSHDKKFFTLKLNSDIARYVNNRAGCSHFLKATQNI